MSKEEEFLNSIDIKQLEDSKKILAEIKKEELDIEKILESINEKTSKLNDKNEEEHKKYKKLEKILKEQKEDLEDIDSLHKKQIEHIIKEELELKRQETLLVKLKKGWQEISSTANLVSSSLNSVSGINLSKLIPTTLWKDNAKSLIDIEDAAYRMSQRAGKGFEGVKELKNTYVDIQANLKDSAENAREITKTLSETGYVKNLGEAAEYISLFSRTTGTSIGQTTEVMNSLTKIGKFSSKEAGTIIANVAKIQKLNGITVQGMNAWAASVNSVTNNMKAFGQTDESIKKMVVSTAKLVSSLEKVGVSAQQTTQWIERLTDPDNIEKNIGLYTQLGISISDALSGNIDGDTIGAGLKDFGQKIKEMGPIAGKAYADAFGISYKEAIKAADMEAAIDTGGVTEQDSKSELEKMKEETLSFNQKQQENINQMIGETQKLMSDLSQRQMMMLTVGISLAMSGVKKVFNSMIDNQKKFDDNRVFKEEEFQAMVIAGDEEGLEKLLEGTISYYDALEELEGKAADNPKLKQQIEEARNLRDVLIDMQNELQSNKTAKSLANNFKSEFKKIQQNLDNDLKRIKVPEIKFGDDFNTNLDALRGVIKDIENANKTANEKTKTASEKRLKTARQMLKNLEEKSKQAASNLKKGGIDASASMNKSSKKVLKNLISGGRRAGKYLERSSEKASLKLKKGAGAAAGLFAAVGFGLFRAADKMWGITDKIAAGLNKLGGFGKFVGYSLGLDMDENKEAVEKNTQELSKNNEIQEEENKPSKIYIDQDTKDVKVKSGIKSVGDITRNETQESSINKTTNASSGQNITDRSAEIVSAIQRQCELAGANNLSVQKIISIIEDIKNKPVNQITATSDTPKGATFANSDNVTG